MGSERIVRRGAARASVVSVMAVVAVMSAACLLAPAARAGDIDTAKRHLEVAKEDLKDQDYNSLEENLKTAEEFLDGDGPPGFFLVRSRRRNDWVRQNAVLLAVGTGPADRLLVSILTAAMGEAGRQIIGCETEEQAAVVIESALAIIGRLSDPPEE